MRKILNILQFLPVTFLLLVMLYFGVRSFIADQFIIPTWPMTPTLVPGDRVVVKWQYADCAKPVSRYYSMVERALGDNTRLAHGRKER